MQDHGDLSEYERLREANIKRNREVMRALGLDDSDFQLHALHKKSGGNGGGSTSGSGSAKRKRTERGATQPSRRSSRVAGLEAEAAAEITDGANCSTSINVTGTRWQAELHASEEEHAAAEEAYRNRWAGKQGKVTIVGTASYGHTLMRVRTMSEPALAKRIKAIERAAGKHAVVKMRLFAQVLCLEGYDDLAADATEALKRVIEILGDPEADAEAETKAKVDEENSGD